MRSAEENGLAPAATRLGMLDGMRMFVGGIVFIVANPAVWPLALVPMLVAVVIAAVFGAAGLWGAGALSKVVVSASGAWATAGLWALRVALGAVAIVAALVVALALAQPLSGFALEQIAQKQQTALGARPQPTPPWLESLVRSVKVTLTGLALGLPLLALLTLVGVLFPPATLVTLPVKFMLSAMLLAWDLLDYPLGIRGMGARARLRWITARFGYVLGFGVAGALVLAVPCIGLCVLPMGVAGAARLVVRTELRPN